MQNGIETPGNLCTELGQPEHSWRIPRDVPKRSQGRSQVPLRIRAILVPRATRLNL